MRWAAVLVTFLSKYDDSFSCAMQLHFREWIHFRSNQNPTKSIENSLHFIKLHIEFHWNRRCFFPAIILFFLFEFVDFQCNMFSINLVNFVRHKKLFCSPNMIKMCKYSKMNHLNKTNQIKIISHEIVKLKPFFALKYVCIHVDVNKIQRIWSENKFQICLLSKCSFRCDGLFNRIRICAFTWIIVVYSRTETTNSIDKKKRVTTTTTTSYRIHKSTIDNRYPGEILYLNWQSDDAHC